MMSREELGIELNCSKRTIITYKEMLEQIGYVIKSTTGKYGGYTLMGSALLPVVGFRSEEVRALQEARHYMKSHQDFRMLGEFEQAMDKLQATISYHEEDSGVYMEEHTTLSKRMLGMIQCCEQAKLDYKVIEIKYRSLRSEVVESVTIHPYEIIHYKGAYYCFAYSLKAKDYRMYKFSEERMKDLMVLSMSFQREREFRLKDHIGKSGLVKDECIEIELYVYDESARWIVEQSIGIDDQKKWIDEHTLYIKTIMEGKHNCIALLLSLKDQCSLLAPQYINDEMKVLLEDMKSAYSHSM